MILGLAGCGSQNTQNSQSSQNRVSAAPTAVGNAETKSTPVSEPIDTAENTTEASTEILTGSSTEAVTETLTDSSSEVSTETLTDSSEEASEETISDGLTEEISELFGAKSGQDIAEPVIKSESEKILVVYYSATGTTEKVANYIAAAAGADLFELVPVNPYSLDDLKYSDENSRVVYEHDNPEARVVELAAATVDNWDSYHTVFIGFPIWWRIAAWSVDRFVAVNDFTGKTVIPFCTLSSTGMGESGELLAEAAGTANWLAAERFSSSDSAEIVQAWVEGLGVNQDYIGTRSLWQVTKQVNATIKLPKVANSVRISMKNEIISNAKFETRNDAQLGRGWYVTFVFMSRIMAVLILIATFLVQWMIKAALKVQHLCTVP